MTNDDKKLTVEDLLRLRDGGHSEDEYLDVPAYSGSANAFPIGIGGVTVEVGGKKKKKVAISS